MSLRNQLLGVLAALFLAVLAAVLLVFVSGTRHYLERQLASHAQDAATALSVTLGSSLGKGDQVLAEAQLVSVFDRGYFKSIDVLGMNREPILQRELPENIEGVPNWFVSQFPIDTQTGEAFVGSGWKQLGKVLVVSQPTFAYQHLWGTAVQLAGWLVALWVAALALLLVVLYLILKPLRAIEKTAIDVQAMRFEPITHRPRAPELARVVLAINQMSRRVGEMLEAETAKALLLHEQVYQDELTGLANRRGYELRLAELLQGEFQFSLGAVIAVELDNMRLFNREHGYLAGEKILQAVAGIGQDAFSDVDVAIFARTNEFSFCFVVVDMTHDEVAYRVVDLHRRLVGQLDIGGVKLIGVPVIGAAYFSQQNNQSELFARADLAVETARQTNRHGFAILEDIPNDKNVLGSQGWRVLIRSALAEGRWRLLFQPVRSLSEPGMVIHTECMGRLVDPQGVLVPASDFIPMASRHRLMSDIDQAVVSQVLARQKNAANGPELVAINLSHQSAGHAGFMNWFQGQLKAHGDLASGLAVEMTEYGALRNKVAAVRLRDLVRSHGGKFGFDNFGLNPEALALMREMLPDYVKLTGSLMTELEAGAPIEEMLKSFVALANSLQVVVIAQQVEREEQLEALSLAGVNAGQGHYFGAPA